MSKKNTTSKISEILPSNDKDSEDENNDNNEDDDE